MSESARAIRDSVWAGRSAVDVTRESLTRLAKANPAINAFTQTFQDKALAHAARVDARVRSGEKPLLAGVPVAIKDNICLGPDIAPGDGLGYGGVTTAASRILERYESPFTATAATKLIEAGAIIIGKTNLDEFGFGSSTEHTIFGPTRNPWDHGRVAGGSSGGSAAAVASGIVPIALGSDTGGSIRQPAALCGVVGVKPTYGRVSRSGLIAFASSLDQIGPLAGSADDAALALEAICGEDATDATTSRHQVPRFSHHMELGDHRLTIGVAREGRQASNHPGVAAGLDAASEALRDAGCRVVEVSLPRTDLGIAAYYIVAPAEASSNLARMDGVRFGRRATLAPGESIAELYKRSRSEGFGPEARRRIMLGTHVLSSGYYDAYYVTALKVRRLILQDFEAAFAQCDLVLLPTAPTPAFKLGEKSGDPMSMYLEDVYTVNVNLAGLPAASVPAGLAKVDGRNLPVGVQLIAPAFGEVSLLAAANVLNRALGVPNAPAP